MLRQLRLDLLIPTLAVAVITLVAACGDGKQVAEVPTAPEEQAPASLEPAPSPTADEIAAKSAYPSDEPAFPQMQVSGEAVPTPPEVPEELKIIWEAWLVLNEDYVDKSKLEDPEAFAEDAVRGMLRVLEDPQTSYVSPEVLTGSFGDVWRGEFEGIGAYVDMNPAGKLIIVSPIEGGPAAAAGIRPGDIILEVDGESVEGLSLLESVAKIRGPKGTPVTLLVKHLGALDPVAITVRRGTIPLPSVLLRSQPGDRFAHIRITDFYPNTVGALRDIILKVVDEGAEGLILDVRDNPGGTLGAVVDVASLFLEDGLVTYVIDGKGRRNDWRVRPGQVATGLPMVLLANERSGSSSEVLAGALQDHDRAKIIGATTFGKGSVNILRDLSNGGGVYITIAHWYTPLGRLIDRQGIEPDIEVTSRDARQADVKQLERAIEELEEMAAAKEPVAISS